MFGNNYGNNGYYPGYGYFNGNPQFMQQRPDQTIFNQLLTADEVAKLKKNPNFSSTKLSEDEYLKAICNHHYNNEIALEKLPNGKHRCTVCQAEFNLVDINTTPEAIERTCNDFYDLLQSIKTYYGNAPDSLREFYLMVGFIPKVKHLWNIARQYFDRVTGGNIYGALNQNGDQNGFVTLSNILGNGPMSGISPGIVGYPQQQFYPQQQPQQGYYYNGPIPQQAMMQTPPQQMPTQQNQQYYQQPTYQQQIPSQQPPQYQYNGPQYTGQPAPSNPIGYVEQQDFTKTQAGQPVSATQTPPMPNPNIAANPNIQNPNIKADVGKKFK